MIDLGASRSVERIACRFLQDQTAWIFWPTSVELAVSGDGRHFDSVATLASPLDADLSQTTRDDATTFTPRHARFARVRATSLGACPDWHPGSAGRAWTFVDEIVVE